VAHDVEPSTGFGGEILDAVRRAVGTRARRWLLGLTLLLGLLAAVGVAAAETPAERTFAALADPVQSLMSVLVPSFGIMLVRDRDRDRRRHHARLLPTLLGAVLLAAAVGAFGVLVCATTLAVVDTSGDAWHNAGIVAIGSVLVQSVAALVGTGLGMLVRVRIVAFLLSIALPLGLYGLLGAVEALNPAQAWLAPYASVRNLLSGEMSPLKWAQWLVVFLIWGVGLNAAGAARSNRTAAHGQ
jgi:hypothetical protein